MKINSIKFLVVAFLTTHLFGQDNKISIIESINYSDKLVSKSKSTTLYKTTFVFTDINGLKHEIPEAFYCDTVSEDSFKPCIYFDGNNYYFLICCLDNGSKIYCYKYNEKFNFSKEIIYDGTYLISSAFFGKLVNNEPVVYFYEPNSTIYTKISQRKNGRWINNVAELTLEDFINVKKIVKPVQTFNEIYKQYPFKHYKTIREYTNPIYCIGDDISNAKIKPTIIYYEKANSRIEINGMPIAQQQSELGECKAFAYAALIQKHICDLDFIRDCNNCDTSKTISYFGFIANTWIDQNGDFDFERKNEFSMKELLVYSGIINDGSFYNDSCKPFYKISEALSGSDGIKKKDEFLLFLQNTYANYKSTILSNKTQNELFATITYFTNMDKIYFNFKKALYEDSFSKFIKILFFDTCPTSKLPKYLWMGAEYYPNAKTKGIVNNEDIMYNINYALRQKKPVLLSNLCGIKNIDGTWNDSLPPHSLLITGYKEVYEKNKPTTLKKLYKIHNSYGLQWQKEHNDGWVDAENLISSMTMVWDKENKYLRYSNDSMLFLR